MYNCNKAFLLVLSALATTIFTVSASAAQPLQIALIAPASTNVGRAIFQGGQMAADEINANGGVNARQIVLHKYDDHASASDGVRVFQRAVHQDHATAVIGNFISEVAMAIEPWAARLKEPYIATGPATTKISAQVHKHYERYKYVFRVNLNSTNIAKSVCDASHDLLVEKLGYKTAVIMSEDYAWTKPFDREYLKCLPKAGLKVLDHIRFSQDTSDFSPIYARIEKKNPDAIIAGLAHAGVKPTIQWHQSQVPALLAGWSSQAGASSFWDKTNGAVEGEITGNYGAPTAALTDKSIPFVKAYMKRFDESPAYTAYTTYDAVYILKNAIERAGSTEANALVTALEKTDYTGTIGQEQFYSRDSKYAHDLKYGKDYVQGLAIQWQNGKQVVVWPQHAATGKVVVPDFVSKANHKPN